ncbi:MAG: hypothetical protein R3310_15940, partial [Candidatus Competibacteraceae bacterium]|nr:hypothetical protein [Candidatus Competibacteraceae bacterium]
FNLDAFLRIPALVLVGELDMERDQSLNTTPRIDRLQGRNRLERAERWCQVMRSKAGRRGLGARHELQVLPGAGHSFEACTKKRHGRLPKRVVEWFFSCCRPPGMVA